MRKTVHKKTISIDREITEQRLDSQESIKRELKELRTRLEGFIERIDYLESQIGVTSKSTRKKESKHKEKDLNIQASSLHNIILIEGDCDLTIDKELDETDDFDNGETGVNFDDLCTVLLIMSNNLSQGDIVYMKKNLLRHLCESILKSSIGDKLPFPEYIQTNKKASKNEEGFWLLGQSS